MSEPERISYHAYVKIEDVSAAEANGWTVTPSDSPLHAPHGCYAILMDFSGEGKPPAGPVVEHAS